LPSTGALSAPEPSIGSRISLAQRLLRLPLFTKLLLVNSAIVTFGAVGGTIITVQHVQAFPDDVHYELIALFMVVGIVISLAVNYVTLKWTLVPLDKLQTAVDEVRRGRLDVRVPLVALSDERFDQLNGTFNQMLGQLEKDRRQLHRLSGAILQAQEDERQRVARELHDETAQSLTSLLLRLRLLERSQTPEVARAHVQELRALTSQALDDVRRVALELRPKILDDLGLGAALAWRVDELNGVPGIRAALHVDHLGNRLPRSVELVLFRVAQEALTNVVRHARASEVQILLRRGGNQITLIIMDNGRGFDATRAGAQPGSGLGLLGMRERVTLAGGDLRIDSPPQGGTRIVASIPLDSPSEGTGHDKDLRIAG
jgi:two-component system sensor histidine kinase UhpB